MVVKLHGDAIAHKTERGLVRLGLTDAAAVRAAAADVLAAATPGRRRGRRRRRAHGHRHARAHRRRAHRRAVRAVRHGRCGRCARPRRWATSRSGSRRSPAPTPTTCSTSCAARPCSARCAASRPSTAPRCATCCSRSHAWRTPSAVSSRSTSIPSSSTGWSPVRGRRTGGAPTVNRLDPFFHPAASSSPARRRTRASSGS